MTGKTETMLTKPERIGLWIADIGVIAIIGFLFVLNGQVGELRGASSGVNAQLASIDVRFTEVRDRIGDFNTRLGDAGDGIKSLQTDVQADLRGVKGRLLIAETDPAAIAREMGYRIGSGYSARFVNNRLYLFPMSDDAVTDLEHEGTFERVQLSPVLQGWAYKKPEVHPSSEPPKQ
jgi:hypothetical protein